MALHPWKKRWLDTSHANTSHELPSLISVITFFGAKRAKKPLTKYSRAKLLQLIYNFHVKTPQKLACLVLLFWCLLMNQITFDYFRSDDHIICIFKHAVGDANGTIYDLLSKNKMFWGGLPSTLLVQLSSSSRHQFSSHILHARPGRCSHNFCHWRFF